MALSREHDDVLWIHNDSEGGATVFAFDTDGALIASVPLPGAHNRDWEDIAVATCPEGGPDGDCLFIADIGDNRATRDGIGLWMLAEPDPRSPGVPDVVFLRLLYPDGPRDAEAIVVADHGRLLLISKGREQAVSVYQANLRWDAAEPVRLVLLQRLTEGPVDLPLQVTGASIAPHGDVIAVRTYATLAFHRLGAERLDALLPDPVRLDTLAEPQGEGVALGSRGTIYLVSEAGPQGVAPRLNRIRCRIP